MTIPDSEVNQSTLTITVDGSATPGVYNLTIFATIGELYANANITLTILSHSIMTACGHLADHSTEYTKAVTPWAISSICTAILITVPTLGHRKKTHNK